MGDLLTTKEAAELLGLSPGTLQNWRSAKPKPRGPAFRRVSARMIRYDTDDLRTWAEGKRVDPEGDDQTQAI